MQELINTLQQIKDQIHPSLTQLLYERHHHVVLIDGAIALMTIIIIIWLLIGTFTRKEVSTKVIIGYLGLLTFTMWYHNAYRYQMTIESEQRVDKALAKLPAEEYDSLVEQVKHNDINKIDDVMLRLIAERVEVSTKQTRGLNKGGTPMKTPKHYVMALLERMAALHNQIYRQGESADWRIDQVSVDITNPNLTIDIALEADETSCVTLPDMRAFERIIEDDTFAITITLLTHDWSYGEHEFIEDIIATNAKYDERMKDISQGTEQESLFKLEEGEKTLITDITYTCAGENANVWRLHNVTPRLIDMLQSNHPTTYEILKIASRRTGQPLEKVPELKPITPEEISGHLRRMHKTIASASKEVMPLGQHHFYRVDKSCSRRQQFYHVVECLGNYPMLNNDMDTLGMTKGIWTTQAVHPSMWSLSGLWDTSYTHYNVRRRHEHFSNTMFPHIMEGWVSLTSNTIADMKSSTHCDGYEVYVADENGTLIAWGYTDDTVEDFVSDVEQFLQLYGKCAIMQ